MELTAGMLKQLMNVMLAMRHIMKLRWAVAMGFPHPTPKCYSWIIGAGILCMSQASGQGTASAADTPSRHPR